jgi:TetR/AcrR family transcriptional regulator, fatty acid biosynthesis regulator
VAQPRPLSRQESKSQTRQRLLEAAATLLGQNGSGALSASAVARAADVAQPTFYVHFRDKDDLLRALGEEQLAPLRGKLRAARERFFAGEGLEPVRETFRLPLEIWTAHPELLRLYLVERFSSASPLAERARRLRAEICSDLAEDLARFGLAGRGARNRERLAMIAEALVAQTEGLALGLVDGRFKSLDAAVGVLTDFAASLLGLSDAASR